MMFAARGIALSFGFFALLYVLLSGVVVAGSRFFIRRKSSPDFLFALRVLPLVMSLIVTLGLMVPSYLLLEPRTAAGEGLGAIPLMLGFFCLLVLGAGACKAVTAQVTSSRLVSNWMKQSSAVESSADCMFCVRGTAPPLSVAGIRKTRVLISETAFAMLAESELETALRHEMAHANGHDNLKKLLFALCAFPGMARLEEAWREAAELAADDRAVRNAGEALDLASALVKLSRLAAGAPDAELTTALVRDSGASLDARVKRLLEWEETRVSAKSHSARWFVLASLLGLIVCAVTLYAPALARVHELSEWLVR